MQNYKLGDLLISMKEKYEEQPAFLFLEDNGQIRSVTYLKFLNDLSRGTAECSHISASRVAVLGSNSYQWIITAFSLLLSGKSLILLDPNLGNDEFQFLLKYTDTECVMMSEELEKDLEFLNTEFKTKPFLKENQTNERKKIKGLPIKNSDFLCFTSGTSKSSKGAVITAEVFVKHILLAENVLPGSKRERFFLPLPLHHMYALTMIFHIMKKGATVCLGTSPRYLKRDATIFNPHIAMLVPSMVDFLFKETNPMPNLYAVILGGSCFRQEQVDIVKKTGAYIINIYGSSETAGFISCSLKGEDERWLKPYGPIKFVLSSDGELGVKLPFCMKGYYKRPKETQAVLEGNCFWTGDAGTINENGYAMVLGRIRDTIVIENGEKIHAEDMDSMLKEIESVEEAAIVYLSEYGICAVIVPTSADRQEQIQKKINLYNRNCSPRQRIRHVWYRSQKLPRTSTGKLKRYVLENEYRNWKKGEMGDESGNSQK